MVIGSVEIAVEFMESCTDGTRAEERAEKAEGAEEEEAHFEVDSTAIRSILMAE